MPLGFTFDALIALRIAICETPQVIESCYHGNRDTFVTLLLAVVRQQFVMGIKCSMFLYRNSFGASQRLPLTWKSFRIAQVSHCAVQRV